MRKYLTIVLTDDIRRKFPRKINRNGPVPSHAPHLGPCWLYPSQSYGVIFTTLPDGTQITYSATRVSYTLHVGPIPEGLFVCHHCDNPPCVNPSHLFLDTQQGNLDDAKRKGRTASGDRNSSRMHPEKLLRGDAHPNRLRPERMARGDQNGMRLHPESVLRGSTNASAKLTDETVTEIRRLYDGKLMRWRDIIVNFGISSYQLFRIVKRKAWAHIP